MEPTPYSLPSDIQEKPKPRPPNVPILSNLKYIKLSVSRGESESVIQIEKQVDISETTLFKVHND